MWELSDKLIYTLSLCIWEYLHIDICKINIKEFRPKTSKVKHGKMFLIQLLLEARNTIPSIPVFLKSGLNSI